MWRSHEERRLVVEQERGKLQGDDAAKNGIWEGRGDNYIELMTEL